MARYADARKLLPQPPQVQLRGQVPPALQRSLPTSSVVITMLALVAEAAAAQREHAVADQLCQESRLVLTAQWHALTGLL